jgi:hypothetical protein
MDITSHLTVAQDAEADIGEAVGPEITGREKVVLDDKSILTEHIETDDVKLQPTVQISPKRSKKLKTEREIPYQTSRTRSKTRDAQSATTVPT